MSNDTTQAIVRLCDQFSAQAESFTQGLFWELAGYDADSLAGIRTELAEEFGHPVHKHPACGKTLANLFSDLIAATKLGVQTESCESWNQVRVVTKAAKDGLAFNAFLVTVQDDEGDEFELYDMDELKAAHTRIQQATKGGNESPVSDEGATGSSTKDPSTSAAETGKQSAKGGPVIETRVGAGTGDLFDQAVGALIEAGTLAGPEHRNHPAILDAIAQMAHRLAVEIADEERMLATLGSIEAFRDVAEQADRKVA